MRIRFDLWLFLALALLGGFGLLGTWGGLSEWNEVTTGLQRFVTVTELSYGVLSLLAIPALLTGWRGLRMILWLWLLAVSLTGGLASVAWGGASAGAGIAASLLAAVIALGVIWVVRRSEVSL